jgi:hypothetical protein
MQSNPSTLDGTLHLSSSVTVDAYRELERRKDREGIANFLYERLSERYIKPVSSRTRHGFAMMACACLLIETMESFWNGWKTSVGAMPGEEVFERYFKRTKQFQQFEKHSTDFYQGVRCGLLHQGETKLGWRITRKRGQPLLSGNGTRTIQAETFLNILDASIKEYCCTLRGTDWNDERWKKCRRKMNAIISNCSERA